MNFRGPVEENCRVILCMPLCVVLSSTVVTSSRHFSSVHSFHRLQLLFLVMFPEVCFTLCINLNRRSWMGGGELRPVSIAITAFYCSVVFLVTLDFSFATVAFIDAKAECSGLDIKGRTQHVGRTIEVKIPPWRACCSAWQGKGWTLGTGEPRKFSRHLSNSQKNCPRFFVEFLHTWLFLYPCCSGSEYLVIWGSSRKQIKVS